VAGFRFPAVKLIGGQGAALHTGVDGFVCTVVDLQNVILVHQFGKGLLGADDNAGFGFTFSNAGAVVQGEAISDKEPSTMAAAFNDRITLC
jgi:hypothetical protein